MVNLFSMDSRGDENEPVDEVDPALPCLPLSVGALVMEGNDECSVSDDPVEGDSVFIESVWLVFNRVDER